MKLTCSSRRRGDEVDDGLEAVEVGRYDSEDVEDMLWWLCRVCHVCCRLLNVCLYRRVGVCMYWLVCWLVFRRVSANG